MASIVVALHLSWTFLWTHSLFSCSKHWNMRLMSVFSSDKKTFVFCIWNSNVFSIQENQHSVPILLERTVIRTQCSFVSYLEQKPLFVTTEVKCFPQFLFTFAHRILVFWPVPPQRYSLDLRCFWAADVYPSSSDFFIRLRSGDGLTHFATLNCF